MKFVYLMVVLLSVGGLGMAHEVQMPMDMDFEIGELERYTVKEVGTDTLILGSWRIPRDWLRIPTEEVKVRIGRAGSQSVIVFDPDLGVIPSGVFIGTLTIQAFTPDGVILTNHLKQGWVVPKSWLPEDAPLGLQIEHQAYGTTVLLTLFREVTGL